ncbi:MAG: monovalent cation/H+ antiporter subunit D family protein [Planctomycetes bacterium]|nr:monovalent cation/H+ antiporter subunit D family protein [Planctomycetota bacterium]
MNDPSPVIAIAIPAVGAVLTLLFRRFPNAREILGLGVAGALFAQVIRILLALQNDLAPHYTLYEMVPGLPLTFHVEPLGMTYALIASGLWIATTLYAIGYVRGNHEEHQTRFFAFFALALAASMGIAFAGDMFTLFVFYELLTLTTFPLVTHHGTEAAKRGGRIYLGVLVVTSVGLLLFGILWTWTITGTLEFRPGGVFAEAIRTGAVTAPTLGVIFFLFIYGTGKAALMPAHRWLPAAMVAPTPVSALLHAVAVVKAGVFTVTKVIVYLFGPQTLLEQGQGRWLPFAAGATIIIASVIALSQDNLKRRLAYSTISQLSYIILGAALLVPISIRAAAVHIAAHAFGKISLFFAAGSIYTAAHKTEISQLDGIGLRMPITMGAFAIGTLSMIGLPPTAGFVSKWLLIQGAWESQHIFAAAVIFASSLLNAAYFLPIVYRAFFRSPPADDAHHGEAPWPILVALSITAASAVALFFWPDLFLDLANQLPS